jgi:predicted nucleic-acid-binding protein
MFQQKDVAAGGTGKVSRYFKKNKNKFIPNESLVNKVLVHQLIQRVSKNVFYHGVNTVLRGTKYVEYVI